MAPTQRAGYLPVQQTISFSLFLEINNLEVDRELACAATSFWHKQSGRDNAKKIREKHGHDRRWKLQRGKKSEDQQEQYFVKYGPNLAVDGRMISMKEICPEDIRKTSVRHVEDVHWQRWRRLAKGHEIGDLKKSTNRTNQSPIENKNLIESGRRGMRHKQGRVAISGA